MRVPVLGDYFPTLKVKVLYDYQYKAIVFALTSSFCDETEICLLCGKNLFF